MPLEAWITLGAIVLMGAALIRNIAGPDVILLGTLALLATLGIVTPGDAVAGFGNQGLITVAALFIVVAGLAQTGAMGLVVQPLLGLPRSAVAAQIRLMLPVTVMSAFLNNTPIVAMFMPVVSDWSRKIGVAPSKLFLPLSYAAILGGSCTLIGTSTNLVVHGLLLAEPGQSLTVGLFDLAWVGVPCAVAGVAYCLIFGRWLLPDRRGAVSIHNDPRQYTAEMIVDRSGGMVGQTIESAGLRHLPGLYLAEIDRDGEVLPAVSPHERLRGGDRLVFVGVIASVVDLRKMRGLLPATDQVYKLGSRPLHRLLIEAVVSETCPLVGQTIREGRFRTTYNAAVIAVARSGQRINRKIGDIALQPGDTLLLEAGRDFAAHQRNNRDFYLVSPVENSTPPNHDRAWIALGILAAMVLLASLNLMSMLGAAMAAATLMVLTRCCTAGQARSSLDWSVLLVIGAAFGIGHAMTSSGLADHIAHCMMSAAGTHPWVALAVIYAITMLFTALITNNAAAVLVYPIARATAESLDVNFLPYAIAIMLAASNDFATPIGYQTNLMVYGPGGYRFSDYLKFGTPLNILVMLIALGLIPLIWSF